MNWPLIILIIAVLGAVSTYLYDKQSAKSSKNRYDHIARGQDETKEKISEEGDRVVASIKDAIANMEQEKPTAINQLRERFPRGFVILGSEDGITSSKPYPSNSDSIKVNAIWSEANISFNKSEGTVTILLPSITYVEGSHKLTIGQLQMGPMPIDLPQPTSLVLTRTRGGTVNIVAELIEKTTQGNPVYVVGFEVRP